MARWGIAYGTSPFYNNVWRQFSPAEADSATKTAHHHINQARGVAHTATDLENALVEALSRRFQEPNGVDGATFDRWDDVYADAMHGLYAVNHDDLYIAALCAEAMMTCTAWQLWDVKSGVPAKGSGVLEALEVTERSIGLKDAAHGRLHPAILHLHIHATEMSE